MRKALCAAEVLLAELSPDDMVCCEQEEGRCGECWWCRVYDFLVVDMKYDQHAPSVSAREDVTLDVERVQEIQDAFDFLIDTIIWMSGSDDFSPDGKAGEEWARRRERFYAILARVDEAKASVSRAPTDLSADTPPEPSGGAWYCQKHHSGASSGGSCPMCEREKADDGKTAVPWDGSIPRPRKTEHGYPSRSDIRWFSEAEDAIRRAMGVVESLGADIRLTKAVGLLGDAQAWVADYIEGVAPEDHYPRPVACEHQWEPECVGGPMRCVRCGAPAVESSDAIQAKEEAHEGQGNRSDVRPLPARGEHPGPASVLHEPAVRAEAERAVGGTSESGQVGDAVQRDSDDVVTSVPDAGATPRHAPVLSKKCQVCGMVHPSSDSATAAPWKDMAILLANRLKQEHHRFLIDTMNEATGYAYAPDELEEQVKTHYAIPGCLHCEALLAFARLVAADGTTATP